MTTDVVVFGAGIVGVSAALHLQARGRSVLLVDRTGVAAETSSGNAGLIERSSVIPYAFPRDPAALVGYALGRRIDGRYDPAFLPKIGGWLFSYWRHSAPARLAEAAAAMLPLIERSVAEHDALAADAGTLPTMRRTGWIEGYRSPASLADAVAEARALERHGLAFDVMDPAALKAAEPQLKDAFVGGIHWRDPVSVPDPAAATRAYADLFLARGGRFSRGDARSLAVGRGDVRFETDDGPGLAGAAVVALGPWSNDVFAALGYRFPLAVKRGYHMHYAPAAAPGLVRPVLDADVGYVLAPMTRGIRLTTGVEFADRDAPPDYRQLERCEPRAREVVGLGARVDATPWLGRRPALPDMRPVIGEAPRHAGLWFAFGHAHHGFTLGPVTGRLLAEMMTGGPTVVDPAPYAPSRFGR
ncbi:NAD(P)/FAD-dependent oxidoreductase [Oharaeibacter diazotrophicus]|uniref:D-lysine oxidase n=1 Tax=Oharaeibacter diazotrophicus TaxID=1920512 RepID=A0A4R6RIA5_9HYPH|nr:FAD-binding oxidoreductase [Oharaeibacter diazotrophicus]TDP86281.1 D-lysine oxidase [Oharaeibacter diazotrophicus]BBE71777.1 D-amino acid dehydrogenase small subunit [Pleomorphomonas sp. SM30]GLS78543.1 FAD-dependent oxidoreductase [Oharaeibacter diazotrophicus]